MGKIGRGIMGLIHRVQNQVHETKNPLQTGIFALRWGRWDLNPHAFRAIAFKAIVSADSTTAPYGYGFLIIAFFAMLSTQKLP